MKVGQKIKFNFANDEKEGVIERLTDKKVYLRVDFPRHKNKLVIRKITALEAAVRNVDGIDDVAGLELLLVTHVEHEGILFVDHRHQLVDTYGAAAATGLVADEKRQEQDEGPHQERMIGDELK